MDIEKTMAFILEHEAKLNVSMDRLAEKMDRIAERQFETEERHDQEIASIRAELRRAVRLSVEEHRRERVRRNELDQNITQLAAAQIVTEEKLQRLIESLHQPHNGN